MIDDVVELLGGFIVLGLILGIVIVTAMIASFVVVPVGLAGAGVLFYLYNIHLPEKRRKEARAHTQALLAQASALTPSFPELETKLGEAGIVSPRLLAIAGALYKQEGLMPPPIPPGFDDAVKVARYQDTLERYITSAGPERFKQFTKLLVDALGPYQASEDRVQGMFTSKRTRSRKEVEELILRFVNDDGHCQPLVDQLNENFRAENEVMPSASLRDDYAWRYLKHTPLLPLANVEEKVSITDRLYHAYLLGSSGAGKTSMIETIIAHDLRSDEDCCVIVIDSQAQLTQKLATLDVPGTTFITPTFNLALNLFDVGYEDMKGQGIEGETLINRTVGLLTFVLEGVMSADFTSPQRTVFQYVIQLVISIPGGNVNTFMDVLAEGGHERYASDIAKLDSNLQRFFAVDYPAPDYRRTREAIRRRMDSLLLSPTFRRLFSATENKIDMLAEMETQNLIVIDTNKPMLDEAPSAFFGRLFIALILRASYRRFGPGKATRPVYLIVDEAHEYFDRSISDMLEQARKANIGLVVAHQSISQARGAKGGSNITDPLMVNTATKLIWTSYRDDASKFAGSMQAKADDILGLPQYTFGMYSRKQGFVPVRADRDALAHFPRRTDHRALKAEMEARYGPSPVVADDEGGVAEGAEPGDPGGSRGHKQSDPGSPGAPPDVEVI